MAGQTWESESEQYLAPRDKGRGDAWTDSGGEHEHRQELAYAGPDTPPRNVAEALRVDSAVVRRRIMYVDDRPVELTDSYYPATIAAGTPLAEPRKIKGGAVTLLAEMGHTIHDVVEEIAAGAATTEQAKALRITEGQPVLTLTRVSTDACGHTLEVSVMTMLSETRLRYRTTTVG